MDASSKTIEEYVNPNDEKNATYKLKKELKFQWEIKVTISANNSRFSCEVFFDSKHKPTETTADNVPDYTFNDLSAAIYVQKYVSPPGK